MQNSCLFNTMVFLLFLMLLLSMYLIFSLLLNSDINTLFTLRSVTRGDVDTISLGDVDTRISLGEVDKIGLGELGEICKGLKFLGVRSES